MADVFLSYASKDRPKAQLLAKALHAHGVSVWWDRTIGIGANFRKEIAQELETAKWVVVLWSSDALASDWVMGEAEDGKDRGVLLQAVIGSVKPPHGFRGYQVADLTTWDGAVDSPELIRLVARITGAPLRAGEQPEVTQPPAPPASPVAAADPSTVQAGWTFSLAKLEERFGRRQLLVVAGASIVGAGVAAWRLTPLTRDGSAPGQQVNGSRLPPRLPPRVHQAHPSRDRRRARTRTPKWEEPSLVANTSAVRSGRKDPVIIHWPHPAVFSCRYRVEPRNQERWSVDQMTAALSKYPGARVNRKQAGIALEILALRLLNGLSTGTAPITATALSSLDSALALLAQAKTWNVATKRTYELAARLVCLRHGGDEAAARIAAAEWFKGPGMDERWKASFLDAGRFSAWHRATTETANRRFLRRFGARIRRAQA
jgi:hypothetical protein